ncbi:MAG: hypothetical protein GX858_00200 [Clostridiales bacterium]|nr:hypothetical protein [Clostridiales bacterium]
MALEVLNSILQAEKLATQTISEAEHSASEAVKNAEAGVREQERQAAVDNRALYQQLMEKKRSEIAKSLEAQMKGRSQLTQNKIKEAEVGLDKAVTLIMDEVTHGHR